MPQYNIRLEEGPLSVHMYLTMPSVTCLWLSYLPCCVFSVSNSGLFFHVSLPGPKEAWRIGLRNIRHRTLPTIWVGTFLGRSVHPGKWF